MVCGTRSPLPDRVPSYGLRGAQLQDWGSHHGVAGGPRRLNDPDAGAVAECGLPPVCQDPKRAAGHLVCLTGTSPSTLNLDRCVSPIIVSVINDVQVVHNTPCRSDGHT